jgi:hypothetical protein
MFATLVFSALISTIAMIGSPRTSYCLSTQDARAWFERTHSAEARQCLIDALYEEWRVEQRVRRKLSSQFCEREAAGYAKVH